MKKAVIEVQFQWVFILIVGGIILLFFASVFSWYKGSKDAEIANTALQSIKSTIVSAQASTDTASIVDIPDSPLLFTCFADDCSGSGCPSYFEFEDTGIRQDTEVDIVFAPDKIESDTLLTWSLPWEMPYKVGNFLFLSNPKVRYVFVYNDDLGSAGRAQTVYDLIPQKIQVNDDLYYEFKKQIVNASEVHNIRDQNDYLVKFVFFFEPPKTVIRVHESLTKRNNWDVIFIYGDEIKGKVRFSKTEGDLKKPADEGFSYLGTATLIGAIFSESEGNYECNMNKAYLRLDMVNLLYRERARLLKDHYAGDSLCEYFYDMNLLDNFDAIDRAIDSRDLDSIAESAQEIAGIQDIMYSQADCPRIY